jgi:hypothetical protein
MRPPGYSDERHAMADDRRLRELLRELRAVGLGALALLVFLCSISFRSRFAEVSGVQRGMYMTSVVLTALAAVLPLAPAAYVRLAPGHRPAEQVTRAVHSMAAGGLAAAGLAVAAAVRLAARWAESGLAADLLGAGTAALFAAAWFVLPRLLSGRLFSAGNEPAQVLNVSLQLQPPPERRCGRELAGMQQRGLALPGAADPDGEVEPPGRLAGERLAGLGPQAADDAGGQRPGQHGQAERSSGPDGRGCGGPVVGMTGDARIVEHEQPAGAIPGGQPGGVRGQFGARHRGQVAIGIVKQRHGRDTEHRPACRSSRVRCRIRPAPAWFSVDASPRV